LVDTDFRVMVAARFDAASGILAGFGFGGSGGLNPVRRREAIADNRCAQSGWTSLDKWPVTRTRRYEEWKITPMIRPAKRQVIGNVSARSGVVMGTIGLVRLSRAPNVNGIYPGWRIDARQGMGGSRGAGRGLGTDGPRDAR